ncbi:HNH endonuclease [Nitratidesulfovibrio sp. 1201_IL3209]|uniref:HNH endonuclease n=1 Tax=Nitratidesulfovibrio sp. 1201_IL3209 TaxID=3084053 RepID=UPI002FDAC186
MPLRPLRPCRWTGCPATTRDPSGYCDAHRPQAEQRRADAAKARAAAHDARRGSSHSRGYGAAWRRLRADVLRDEPLCRECARQGRVTPATDVDHIVARSRGGTDDRANLQPLCHRCHSRKTAREDGGRPLR